MDANKRAEIMAAWRADLKAMDAGTYVAPLLMRGTEYPDEKMRQKALLRWNKPRESKACGGSSE